MKTEEKPRLLVLASTFPRFSGDAEPRFILDFAKSLTGRYDVTALVPAAPGIPLREDMEGVHVRRYRYAPARKWETLAYPGAIIGRIRQKPARALLVPLLVLGLWRALRKELKTGKYALVHAHWLIPQGIVASAFFAAKYPPFVVTAHGGDVFDLDAAPVNALKRRALRRAAGVTVVSNKLKEKIAELVPGVSAEVLPMGCDLARFSSQKRVEGYYRAVCGEGPVVLFVGRLVEYKGVDFLLEAMKLPPLAELGAKLVIIGGGPRKELLEKKAAEPGLSGRVFFLEPKSHDELPAAYASADVFCAPSFVTSKGSSEGFGLVLVEAAASGLPVVSTRVGGIADAVKDGETGFLVEEKSVPALASALGKLLADRELREKMGRAGHEFVKKFSWESTAGRYCAFYDSIGR